MVSCPPSAARCCTAGWPPAPSRSPAASCRRRKAAFPSSPAGPPPTQPRLPPTARGAWNCCPSHLYPKGWLRVRREEGWNGQAEHLFALPSGNDPYGEIYGEKEAWWRLVDPQLLDPVGNYSSKKKGFDPRKAWEAFLFRISAVKIYLHGTYLDQSDYHDFKKDFQKTFVFYGQGNKSFASVRWRLPPDSQFLSNDEIREAKGSGGDLLGMRRFVSGRRKERPGLESASPFLFPKDSSGPIRSYPVPGGLEDAMERLGISAFIAGLARLQPQDGDGDGCRFRWSPVVRPAHGSLSFSRRPEILCSMVSATSKGFFKPGGRAMPAVSFKKHAPTGSSAGTQNSGFANHGNFAFCSSVLALNH